VTAARAELSAATGPEVPADVDPETWVDEALDVAADEVCHLRLYVAGQSPKSMQALVNLRRLCDQEPGFRYRIEVIDLLEQPGLAAGDDIVAIPTVVRRLPAPMRKIIGDLSSIERVALALQLLPADR